MADAVVTLPADGTGKNLDHESLTVGTNTVYRQRQQIAGASAAEVARVLNADPVGSEYGLVVRTLSGDVQVIQGQQSALQSGSIVAANTVVGPFACTNYNLATVGIAGTYNGVTAVFEGTPDGSNWFALQGQQTDTGAVATGPVALTNTVRAWDIFIGSWTQFRVRATAWTSGSATILVTFQTMPTEPVPSVIVVGASAGATPFSVAITTTSAVILAANTNRKGATIRADGSQPIYVGFGVTPSTTSYGAYIPAGAYYETPFGFTGAINGIASATGTTARGQEFS